MDEDSSNKFIGSLTKFLQSLCNGYVEFQRGVELVGHIYLNIDTGEKVDYILHEKVSKNDENSVSFVSNSFHAQPQDKTKETPSKPDAKNSSEKSHDDDDDDDIMIVDHSQGSVGSTNSGSVLSRGVKRLASPGADYRHGQRARASAGLSSAQNTSGHSFSSVNRQHSGRSSATVTSQGGSQNENLNISDVKLEQISRDELLSLASQVSDGTTGAAHSSSSASRSQPQHSGMSSGRGDAAMWVKQEVTDDGGGGGNDTGWSQERDDSSNSGSNLYPVMLHQNPAFPSSSVAGFSGSGNQSAVNPFPMPGTSQDMSGLDPSGFPRKMGHFTPPVGTEAQRQKRSFMYGQPMSKFGAQALRQRSHTKGYVPTSLLSEEEKAHRRERVRLQVRAYRLRKKQQQIEQQLDADEPKSGVGQGGFYHFPQVD